MRQRNECISSTDPPYGGQFHEGDPDAAGGASNPQGHLNPRIEQPAGFTGFKREPQSAGSISAESHQLL